MHADSPDPAAPGLDAARRGAADDVHAVTVPADVDPAANGDDRAAAYPDRGSGGRSDGGPGGLRTARAPAVALPPTMHADQAGAPTDHDRTLASAEHARANHDDGPAADHDAARGSPDGTGGSEHLDDDRAG